MTWGSRSGSDPPAGKAPPVLSGLDEDDDEDESVAKAKPGSGPGSRPGSRPVPAVPYDDGATTISENPFAQRGAVEVTGQSPPPAMPAAGDGHEPSVKIDASLLGEMLVPEMSGEVRPEPPRRTSAPVSTVRAPSGPVNQPVARQPARPVSQPVPRPAPARTSGPLPSLHDEVPPEATRILEAPQRLVSGPVAMIRPSMQVPVVSGPGGRVSGPNKVIVSGLADLGAPEGSADATRIVQSINLTEGKEARGRRTREKARQAAKLEAEMRKSKKNPALVIKAASEAKEAPVDPQRLQSQKEAQERKAGGGSLMSITGIGSAVGGGLGEDMPQEGTMIGRFLGLVGMGSGSKPYVPAASGPDPVQPARDTRKEARAAAAEAAFLEGLNPQLIEDAVQSGDLQVLDIRRDDLVEVEGRTLVLLDGELCLGRFPADIIARERRAQKGVAPGDKKAEKREQHRRMEIGPLIRLTEANLAVFREGDVVNREVLPELGADLALFAVTGVRALSLSGGALETWRRTYQFFGDRLRRAGESARARLQAANGARALVADFFVRHGISIARTLRVREVDKCIECYECEKACETRFGVPRLSVKGKILGGLDFVDCCRTCVDQRCIDPCAYDAIKYDAETKEVRILEEACTGCSLCALSCPYDAIEMQDLELKPLLRLRLEKDGKLGFGDGKGRKAQIHRIASKCDHCLGYEDQACISACPTACLLEVPPESLFIERTEEMADAAAAGFGRVVEVDENKLYDPSKFFHGLSDSGEKGPVVEKRRFFTGLWVVGLTGVLGCFLEVLLRRLLPAQSVAFYYLTHSGGLDPDIALQNIGYLPGGTFSVWLGAIGSILMFSSTLYSARKWIPGLTLGSQGAWFSWHMFASTIGASLVLLHSAGKIDNWVSLALWSMVATVLSGIVGRYVSTELPDLAEQAKLHVLELERRMTELRNRHSGVTAADRYLQQLRQYYAQVNAPGRSSLSAVLLTFWILLLDDLTRPFRRFRLRRLLHGIKDRRARAQVARLASKLALVERRRVLLPRIQPFFREWKLVHIPFAVILSVLAGIHITLELLRSF